MTESHLQRDAFGRLVFTADDGQVFEGVVPVRAFPIAAPEEGIAIVAADGHELAWHAHLTDIPASDRKLVEEELASREFMPQILRLKSVSTFATPSTWEVVTDRGTATFVLRGEEDIRRLSANTLLIADMHGLQFLIHDLTSLDRHSRKLLDRFL